MHSFYGPTYARTRKLSMLLWLQQHLSLSICVSPVPLSTLSLSPIKSVRSVVCAVSESMARNAKHLFLLPPISGITRAASAEMYNNSIVRPVNDGGFTIERDDRTTMKAGDNHKSGDQK